MVAALRRRGVRRAVALVTASVVVLAGALIGHSIGSSLGHPTAREITRLTPTQPAATAPPVLPESLQDVARTSLASTFTVEDITTTDEQFGTAWLIDNRGDLVTNAHVIAGERSIRIRDRQGGTHLARVLLTDAVNDVAVLRLEDHVTASPLTVATDDVTPAQGVVVLASSRATGHGDVTQESVVAADVSVTLADDPDVGASQSSAVYNDMIAVHGATIYPGNSGGPMLDAAGRVVGIVTLSSRTAAEAYAIPVTRVIGEIRTATAGA